MIDAIEKLPKLNPVDARIVLQDLYESHYGIYNHLSASMLKPLASVAMHPCEDINEHSLLERTMNSYIDNKVKDFFGINVLEFLDLPMDIIQVMIKICNQKLAQKSNTLSDIEKQFRE